MNKVRVRFGLSAISIFPNVGIFVIYMAPDRFDTLKTLTMQVKAILESTGYASIGNRLVCEAS